MDITQPHSPSEKENLPPSPSKVSYPELPNASPAKRQKHIKPFKAAKKHHTVPPNSPASHYDGSLPHPSALSPRSPPNIGRSRAPGNLSARLQQTPPRPSYSDKVRNIFSTAASRSPSKPLFPNLVSEHLVFSPADLSSTPSTVVIDGSSSGSSTLTSESELEKRLEAAKGPQLQEPQPRNTSSMNAAAAVFERSPATVTSQAKEAPSLKSPTAATDISSDSWTGDEEFLPKTARQQARLLQMQKNRERMEQARREREERRLAEARLKPQPGIMSPEGLRRAAESSREVRRLLEISPLRKTMGPDWDPRAAASPSRFQSPAKPISMFDRDSPPPTKNYRKPSSHRSSDADDEEDSDPDR